MDTYRTNTRGAVGDEPLRSSFATIEEFCQSVLWLECGYSAKTQYGYAIDLKTFARWLATRGVDHLYGATREHVADFLAECQPLKATTIRRRIAVLKRFYQRAYQDARVTDDPCSDLSAPPLQRGAPKALSVRQIEALLNAPRLDNPLGLRDRALLELMYASGMRVSETVNVRSTSLDFQAPRDRGLGQGGETTRRDIR